MCFSAEVSFGASAILSTTGFVCIKKMTHKNQLYFALIPILFGVQQFFEGWLWIALQNEGLEKLESVATYGFLIFAHLIWPIWVPLSVYKLESNATRRKYISASIVLGVVLFLLLGYRISVYDVQAQIEQFHIYYTVGHFESTNWWSGIFYLLPAVFPFIFSSKKEINYLGILMLALFVVAKIFYLKFMISIWCFFAALLSIYIYFIIQKKSKK